jgi:hypothetical protein
MTAGDSAMDVNSLATCIAQLATLIGPRAASVIGAIIVLVVLVAHGVMPWLPVADAHSSAWYRSAYTVLRLIAGNYANAAPGKSVVGAGSARELT